MKYSELKLCFRGKGRVFVKKSIALGFDFDAGGKPIKYRIRKMIPKNKRYCVGYDCILEGSFFRKARCCDLEKTK